MPVEGGAPGQNFAKTVDCLDALEAEGLAGRFVNDGLNQAAFERHERGLAISDLCQFVINFGDRAPYDLELVYAGGNLCAQRFRAPAERRQRSLEAAAKPFDQAPSAFVEQVIALLFGDCDVGDEILFEPALQAHEDLDPGLQTGDLGEAPRKLLSLRRQAFRTGTAEKN